MPSVVLSEVSFSYSSAVPILRDVSFELRPGYVGVVGANGAGKTTLLRLLARELCPDSGEIRFHPNDLAVEYCVQTVDRPTDSVHRFARSDDADACRLRSILRCEPRELDRWSTLSPGERKRWQIGAALSQEPELLLLDEPTNHVDDEARTLLVEALMGYRGIGVLVTHDRDVLETLTRQTLRFHQREVTHHSGAYSVARAGWEHAEREHRDSYQSLRREQRKLRRRLADKRRDRATAERSISTRSRMKGPRDHDARSMRRKGRVRNAEAKLSREVGKLRRGVEGVTEQLEGFHFERELGRSIFVDYVQAPKPVLVSMVRDVVSAGPHPLLHDIQLTLNRGARIHLSGPNGSGKTTLLTALRKESRLPCERILHLPQELSSSEGAELLEQTRLLPPEELGRVLNLVAALGVDPDALLASAHPSPGEARKLCLAHGMGRHAWALLLDEPTNHLDLPSVERLEEALAAFPGAILLITHDAALASRVTDRQWRIEDRRVLLSTPLPVSQPMSR